MATAIFFSLCVAKAYKLNIPVGQFNWYYSASFVY